ncbi:hypothetical protein J6590_019960, partial [Homalodisca vitripennis]
MYDFEPNEPKLKGFIAGLVTYDLGVQLYRISISNEFRLQPLFPVTLPRGKCWHFE